ncbi:hypothetical protein [Actinoallomurus sp. NPDC050550]|uniref:hypothetical protein n=1 Tax=Actinoallomurus sp. NPDC050550 TaxID=3154937 RepID=UPI0033E8D24B
MSVPVRRADAADTLAPYLQVADALRSRIRFGDLAPGDKLPPPASSPSTTRSRGPRSTPRCGCLHGEGLTTSRKGAGVFVAKHPLPPDPQPRAPKIRVHRFEAILAIKWPHLDRWLSPTPGESTERTGRR